MIVQTTGVQVCGNDNFKAVAPQLLCQLHADLVALIRRDFARLEALRGMKGHVAAGLSVPLLGHGHLLCRRFGNAIDAGYITEMVGLVRVFGIVQHL